MVPWLCCMAPAIALFATYGFVFVSVLFSSYLAELITAVLTFITWLWISNLSMASFAGVFKMRQAATVDWHAKLHEMPLDARAGLKHIVLLPNYQESEKMLKACELSTAILISFCIFLKPGDPGQLGAKSSCEVVCACGASYGGENASWRQQCLRHVKGQPGRRRRTASWLRRREHVNTS